MKAALLATVLPLLAGCATGAQPDGPIRLGQTAYANGPRVRPDAVIEDSRCPPDTQCVWAGRLVVRVTVYGGNWSRQLDLTAGVPATVADGSLTLTTATPPAGTAERHTKPPRYRFTVDFQGGI